MALPTLDKTWSFDINNLVNNANIVNNIKQLLMELKNVLVTAGWTVRGSCDGAGGYGNDDDTDRWVDTGDLVWAAAGSNHSWCVLQSDSWAARGYHLFVLLECKTSSAASYPGGLRISIAQSHYSGGTATAAPTATTEVELNAGATSDATQFFPENTTQSYWHAMWDSAEECFRWILCQSSKASAMIIIERIKNPLVAEPDEYVAAAKRWGNSATDKMTLANFNTAAGLSSWVDSHGAVTYYITCEFCGTSGGGQGPLPFFTAVNPDDNSAWPILPMGLVTLTDTSYAYGRNGDLYDLWWGSSYASGPITGDTYGADVGVDDFKFVQFGHFIFPWDGASTPSIA